MSLQFSSFESPLRSLKTSLIMIPLHCSAFLSTLYFTSLCFDMNKISDSDFVWLWKSIFQSQIFTETSSKKMKKENRKIRKNGAKGVPINYGWWFFNFIPLLIFLLKFKLLRTPSHFPLLEARNLWMHPRKKNKKKKMNIFAIFSHNSYIQFFIDWGNGIDFLRQISFHISLIYITYKNFLKRKKKYQKV